MDHSEFQKALSEVFSDMSDFSVRTLTFDGETVILAYIGNFSSKKMINSYIVEPISRAYERKTAKYPLASLITNAKVEALSDLAAATDAILSGNAVVFRDGEAGFGIAVFTKNEEGRSQDEPETENVIRGPHEGFTENGESNAMLLRRRLHTARLKKKSLTVGTLSKTDVSVLYIEGIARRETVEEVLRRLRAIETDIVPDSGAVEQYLQDGKAPLYPTVGNSERPDKVAAKLSEGRIAVVVDGSPVVLTVPYLFCEAFQVTEDYAKSPWYGTFIRTLRFVAFLLSLYLPALFTAFFVRHRALVPQALLRAVEEARSSLPFSIFWEVFLLLLIFEAVREVGLRMPKAVGSAVGLVGSLILGDSAIKAGLASAPVLIVVALSAVCNFMVPPYMNSNVLYRFGMLAVSAVFGLLGFFGAVFGTALHFCKKSSVGTPYLSPMAPLDFAGLRDFLYMASVAEKGRAPISVTGRVVPRGKRKERYE